MVLDLRLTMKIGCRDDNLFFFKGFFSWNVAYLKNIDLLWRDFSKN